MNNLPYNMTIEILQETFTPMGEIEKINMHFDRQNKVNLIF